MLDRYFLAPSHKKYLVTHVESKSKLPSLSSFWTFAIIIHNNIKSLRAAKEFSLEKFEMIFNEIFFFSQG